jgi:hypothetical protein
MSTNTKTHPLALPDDYDDDDFENIVDINMSKHKTSTAATSSTTTTTTTAIDNINNNNYISANKNVSRTQVKTFETTSQNVPPFPSTKLPTSSSYKKRIAPAPPPIPPPPNSSSATSLTLSQQQNTITSSSLYSSATNLNSFKNTDNTSTNANSNNSLMNNSGGAECYFFIDIHHVRWFYKGEKSSNEKNDKETVSNANVFANLSIAAATAAASATTADEMTTSTTSNDSVNNNTNNANNNLAGNSDVNVHRISSKKWLMFNKRDSYNLELEYRDMISKKLLNVTADPPKTVQVLDSLYEVNIMTKKCYSIYWKSRIISVMRAIWFTDNGEPFDEKSGEEIERRHIDLFRGDLLKSFDSDGSLNSDVDGLKIGSDASSTSPTEEIVGPNGKTKTIEIKVERKHLNIS